MATRSLGTLTLDLIAKIGGYVGPLDKAARTTKKNANDMSKDLKNIGIAVAALGSSAAIAFAAIAKASINTADDLSKASQQVGYSVESLSALKFTAGLAGVEFESLVTSLGKFNKNISDTATNGTGAAADAFASLNINLRSTDGQLKTTEVLFSEVAEKLSMMEDGARKTALAQELLGRSGSKLIPLLNAGAEGIRLGAEEAQRLGQIIGTDAARAAEQFNDNLSRLQSSVTGVANIVAMSAAPALAELTNVFADPDFQGGVSKVASAVTGLSAAVIDLAEDALPLLIGVVGARLSSAVIGSTAAFAFGHIEAARYQYTLMTMAGVSAKTAASQTALAVATRGAGAAMMLLGGPVGAAILAGGSLAYLATRSSDAEERIERLRASAKAAADDIEKMGGATKKVYAAELQTEIDATEKQIKELQEFINNADTGKTFTSAEYYDQTLSDIELLNKSLGELKKRLSELSQIPPPKPLSFDPIISADAEKALAKMLDDDFEKLIKKQEEQREAAKKLQEEYEGVTKSLEKQIALYGNTSRAIEVRYDLEHGYLAGITPAQEKYYIKLAEQLDLLEKQKDLIAELDEFDWSLAPADPGKTAEFLKFTEDAAERINGAFSDAWMNIEGGWKGLRDGIVDSFKRMLAEMAHEAITKPIVMRIQQSMTGGGAAGGQGAGNAVGAVGAGGWYAAIALAVVAGANVWNKSQEEKFAKMTAEYRQGTQFMGTILGQGNKKSESISNSIELLAGLTDESLGISSAMLNELVVLNNNMGIFAAGIAKEFGASGLGDFSNIATGKSTFGFNNAAIKFGDSTADVLLGGLGDRLFGSKVTDFVKEFMGGVTTKISENLYSKRVKIIDSGIKVMGQSLADMLESGVIDAYAYADVNTRKKVLGMTTSNKTREELSGIDEDVRRQFAKVFENGAETMRLASQTFGIDFDKYIDSLRIDTSRISLKGLEGDALTKELEAFFSSTLDDWVGDITTQTERIERELKSGKGGLSGFVERFVIGLQPQFRTVQTKAGELIKQYQQIGEGAFETFVRLAGETESFIHAAERLSFNFNMIGVAAVETVQQISQAAGGFEELSKLISNYSGKFMSEAEQFAYAEKVVNESFGKLDLAVPKTREAFTALVQGIDLATESGREQFAAIMKLVDLSDVYIGALEKQAKAAEEAQKAAIGGAFESLTEAIQAQRDVLDKINQTAIDALQKSLSEHQAVANSLSGALSNMSLESSRAELLTRRAAQAQLIAANAIAKAGGPLPSAAQLDDALEVIARPSQELYATFEEYARDFYTTQKNLRELQEAAVGQVSIDEQALKAQQDYYAAEMARYDTVLEYYQAHLDTLNGIDTRMLTVAEAMNELVALLQGAGMNAQLMADINSPSSLAAMQSLVQPYNYTPLAETPVNNVSAGYVGTDLLTEVRQLREELEASQFAIAKNTNETRKILDRWDTDGLPLEREEDA